MSNSIHKKLPHKTLTSFLYQIITQIETENLKPQEIKDKGEKNLKKISEHKPTSENIFTCADKQKCKFKTQLDITCRLPTTWI